MEPSYGTFIHLIFSNSNKPTIVNAQCSFCKKWSTQCVYTLGHCACYETCIAVNDFIISFKNILPLINIVINTHLISDIKRVLYQALINNMYTWVPECVQIKRQIQLYRTNYVSIKYKSMTIKQLTGTIVERGLSHPKNASKSRYQNIIQRDIEAKKKEWKL
jgi:hypothetical protein